jgi:hypothetical protein
MNNHALVANWITPRNQGIAFWLIKKHKIQQGYRLAYYLKVPICSDNYTAICMWVQYQSQRNTKKPSTLGELSAHFRDLLPQTLLG